MDHATTFTLEPGDGGTNLTMSFQAEQPPARLNHRIAWLRFGRIGLAATRR